MASSTQNISAQDEAKPESEKLPKAMVMAGGTGGHIFPD
jgi:hypothetical protein